MTDIQNAVDRTESKIRYARLHLEELKLNPKKGFGEDYERAHQESFFFHLFGAWDAFLHEINLHYQCGLDLKRVNITNLWKFLELKGGVSQEINDAINPKKDTLKWMNVLKEFRDHAMHRKNVPLIFFKGGEQDGEVHLKNIETGADTEIDYIIAFDNWIHEMEELIKRLRSSFSHN